VRRVSLLVDRLKQHRWNWPPWAGFVLCLVGFASLPVLARFPATRDVPWVNFLLFGSGLALLFVGLRRAFGQPHEYRGKIAGPILVALSILVVGLFCFLVFYQTRQLPASTGAPKVGEKAPEFVLTDSNNQPVSLASLLSTPFENSKRPPKGVVLVFYRGYW